MPFVFTGKKFLVTGAGRDIGRALAESIATAGGEVYVLGRNKEHIESLATEYDNIHPIVVDLSDWEATRKVLEKLPAFDGVVNNASSHIVTSEALDMSKDVLTDTFCVTLLAPINVIQVTAKAMIEAGINGAIVNISSVAAIKPTRGCLGYNTAKAGLDMITKQFALELGPHQIRVNSVNPTQVSTQAAKAFVTKFPELDKGLKAITPLGRWCEIREVVELVMYLLSEHSTMVTGTLHVIDGGLISGIPV